MVRERRGGGREGVRGRGNLLQGVRGIDAPEAIYYEIKKQLLTTLGQ